MFLCYAGEGGSALLDRELYLPREWTGDRERCRAAGIPDEVEFATKPELARRMIERALNAGTPCGWVTGDAVYGGDSKLRRWLEARQQAFVLAVSSNQRLWWPDFEQQRVDRIVQGLPRRAWKRCSAGAGAKGERLYDWSLLRLTERDGWEKALLVRRSIPGLPDEQPEFAYYLTYAPCRKSSLETLAQVAGRRWEVEIAFEAAKGECGLDHYEVPPLAGLVPAHDPGHAGPCGVDHSACPQSKKLYPAKCRSVCPNCAACGRICSGPQSTALSTS